MIIKLTTLSENTANYSFLAEGLSILVEVDGLKLLADTKIELLSRA